MPVKVQIVDSTERGMCNGCASHCCKLTVGVTTYDVFRIMMEEKKDAAEFMYVAEADWDDAFAFRAQGKLAKIILKHRGDSCVFLNEKQECTIEKSKPYVCLAYPFSLKDGALFMRPEALCPLENKARADTHKMSVDVLKDAQWEWDRYQEIVDDWNRSARGDEKPSEFIIFAGREMELEKSHWGSFLRKARRFCATHLKFGTPL